MTLFSADNQPPRKLTLVKLSSEIASALAPIGRVSVEGEVYRPTTAKGGTVYFTLRDRAAQIGVRCPPARVARCRAVAGERVCATGILQYDNTWGRVQFVADEVAPVGAGAVAAAIADARRRLAEEGLIDRARRPIPRLPNLIGVVCGADAAVRADIESVVATRFPGYPVEFAQVAVSGAGAAEAVIGAVREFDARPDVEVIILARGGGDATQLLTFSDEELCRVIATATTPVVSAIGHEGDRPLCDDLADLRCGTPSIAAAAVVPSRVELGREIDDLVHRAFAGVERMYGGALARLESVAPARALDVGLAVASSRLHHAAARFDLVHPRRRLDPAHQRLRAVHRQLEALSPARVLERGYAVVRRSGGGVIRSPHDVSAGIDLTVEVAGGTFGARVT